MGFLKLKIDSISTHLRMYVSIKEDDASKEEADRLSTRYYVNAHHLYRQTIKYDKYLKQLKYRQ